MQRLLEEGEEEGADVLYPGQDKDRLKKPEEDKDEEDPQEEEKMQAEAEGEEDEVEAGSSLEKTEENVLSVMESSRTDISITI